MWEIKGELDSAAATEQVDVIFSLAYKLESDESLRKAAFAITVDLNKVSFSSFKRLPNLIGSAHID